eukprot:3429837-Alexandrium_andersonii.AAC.1
MSSRGDDMTGDEASAWMDAQGGYNVDKSNTAESLAGFAVSVFATIVGPSHDELDAALWRQCQHD